MAQLESPITLVGLGRSGTTLIEHVFRGLPHCCSTGETGGVIFGTFAGALHSFFDSKDVIYDSRKSFAASVTRQLLRSIFPITDDRFSSWFHKPAGLPKILAWEKFRSENDVTLFPTTWYWDSLHAVFPDARYITVLRNPWDIIASRSVFSGWPEKEGWEDIRFIYDIYEHSPFPIDFVFYDDILDDPFFTISSLLSRVGETCPSDLQRIVDTSFVPSDKDLFLKARSSLAGPDVGDPVLENVSRFWSRFGRGFQSPRGMISF